MTLSSFQQRAAAARKQSGSIFFHINPLVTNATRHEWEQYAAGDDSNWIEQGLFFQGYVGLFANTGVELEDATEVQHRPKDSWPIWGKTPPDNLPAADNGFGPFMPTWQTSPVVPEEMAPAGGIVNENILRTNRDGSGAILSFYSKSVVLGSFLTTAPTPTATATTKSLSTTTTTTATTTKTTNTTYPWTDPGSVYFPDDHIPMVSLLLSAAHNTPVTYEGSPISQVYFPVFDSFRENRKPVGVMVAWLHWMDYFVDILPNTAQGIHLVLRNNCNGIDTVFTFEIKGEEVINLGPGDQHDTVYDNMLLNASFDGIDIIEDGSKFGLPLHKDLCMVTLEVYPSQEYYNLYNDANPMYMTMAVAVVFVISALLFLAYDRVVARRQALVMKQASQTHSIVTSLFPENVRERLMKQAEEAEQAKKANKKGGGGGDFANGKRRLKGYLDDDNNEHGDGQDGLNDEDPIADLFPHCTVLFADIAGFTGTYCTVLLWMGMVLLRSRTVYCDPAVGICVVSSHLISPFYHLCRSYPIDVAWSSTRDPAQVFILLQNVYEGKAGCILLEWPGMFRKRRNALLAVSTKTVH